MPSRHLSFRECANAGNSNTCEVSGLHDAMIYSCKSFRLQDAKLYDVCGVQDFVLRDALRQAIRV